MITSGLAVASQARSPYDPPEDTETMARTVYGIRLSAAAPTIRQRILKRLRFVPPVWSFIRSPYDPPEDTET